jgi:hypothetical protein
MKRSLFSLVLFLASTATTANAAQITVEHEARGWINLYSGAIGRAFQQNFIVGEVYDQYNPDVEYRNFFAFRVPALAPEERVVAAELHLSAHRYDSADPTETFELHHVSAPSGTIGVRNFDWLEIHYADLADGPSYGSRAFSGNDQNQVVAIPLNGIALADINAAAGGLFELGGVLTTLAQSPQFMEVVFSGSHLSGHFSRLQLTTAVVPEPSSWSMLLAASPIAWFAARRRAASVRH